MKKTLLISIGIILILLTVGVWAYLFTYGTPKSADEVFARFGFGDNAPIPDVVVVRDGDPIVDVSDNEASNPEKLRQLTVRPVSGAAFTELGILYVEEGTGHVYHIDLDTGEEKLLSGTTIPGTHDAVFSTDGSYVAISAISSGNAETIAGFIDTLSGSIDGVSLPARAREIGFSGTSSKLYYLLPSETGSAGYLYDIDRGFGTEVFRIPLRDVRVLWGEPSYVYTTPSASAWGYFYEVQKNTLSYVTDSVRGLAGIRLADGFVLTGLSGGGISSTAYFESGTTSQLSLPLIPEKCVAQKDSPVLFCGIPSDSNAREYPDGWYMGTFSYNDSLWRINAETGGVEFLADFLGETGRELDVLRIGTDDSGELIYFINKNDNTLWMFDTML